MQQPPAFLHPQLHDIFPQIAAHVLLEQIAQVVRADVDLLRHFEQGKPFFRVMLVNVGFRRLDDPVVLHAQLFLGGIFPNRSPLQIAVIEHMMVVMAAVPFDRLPALFIQLRQIPDARQHLAEAGDRADTQILLKIVVQAPREHLHLMDRTDGRFLIPGQIPLQHDGDLVPPGEERIDAATRRRAARTRC